MCALALVASVKMPVDSRTISTPSSPHGRAAVVLLGKADHLALVDDDRAVAGPDVAVIRAVCRVARTGAVHLGIDQIIERDDLDIRRALDQRLERLAADPAEAVDARTRTSSIVRTLRSVPDRWLRRDTRAFISSGNRLILARVLVGLERRAPSVDHIATDRGPGGRSATALTASNKEGSRSQGARLHGGNAARQATTRRRRASREVLGRATLPARQQIGAEEAYTGAQPRGVACQATDMARRPAARLQPESVACPARTGS